MNTIKLKTIRLVPVNIVVYILLAIIVIFIGLAAAQIIQTSNLNRESQKLDREIATLRAEQERLAARIEGQASSKERVDDMALSPTGRIFSIEKYRQWNKAHSGGNRLPDWVHACNGQPVLKENGTTNFVRGLDGEYRPSAPEWEVPVAL